MYRCIFLYVSDCFLHITNTAVPRSEYTPYSHLSFDVWPILADRLRERTILQLHNSRPWKRTMEQTRNLTERASTSRNEDNGYIQVKCLMLIFPILSHLGKKCMMENNNHSKVAKYIAQLNIKWLNQKFTGSILRKISSSGHSFLMVQMSPAVLDRTQHSS